MAIRCTYLTTFIGALLLATSAAAESPAIWPQWRGPTRDGQVGGSAWQDSLKGDRVKQLWRVEMGPGYPGPIVGADRVFTAETADKSEEVVHAYDRATGKELWHSGWKGAMVVPFFAKANGDWIRSTPAYDGDSLYVAGMRDMLVCLNAADGKERWRVDFLERFKTDLPAFGFVCSPLVDGDFVYVQAGSSVVKLNKKTGETVWRSVKEDGGMQGGAFSSPILAKIQGKTELLVQTRTKLAGVDPATGDELWSQPVETWLGMNILTPTVFGDAVFTSAYGGKSLLYQIDKSDDKLAPKETWNIKVQGYMSSPVVVDGHAYLHLRNQRFACIDLKDGKVCWTTEKAFGKYWSLVAQKDRILALDETGMLYLIKANPEKFELLDSRQISDAPAWGHLAVCGDELFVRELNALAAYRWH